MASIIVSDIDELISLVFPEERTANSSGELGLDERLVKIYNEKGYDSKPKTEKEADLIGEKHFNGLQSSIPYFSVSETNGKKIVVAHLAPTRYLFGQAMKDFTKTHPDVSQEVINEISPKMANVSLLVPVKEGKQYFLLAQIKGKAVGSGQIQAALVAGGVNYQDLQSENPFLNALKHEVSEEVGLDLSYLKPTSFLYLVDERKIGNLNFVAVAEGQRIDDILTVYESLTKKELQQGKNLEVMALSQLDIAGLSLIPVEGGHKLEDCLSYFPSENGLTSRRESRTVRPYTEAIVNYLKQDQKNVKTLLKRAGF